MEYEQILEWVRHLEAEPQFFAVLVLAVVGAFAIGVMFGKIIYQLFFNSSTNLKKNHNDSEEVAESLKVFEREYEEIPEWHGGKT